MSCTPIEVNDGAHWCPKCGRLYIARSHPLHHVIAASVRVVERHAYHSELMPLWGADSEACGHFTIRVDGDDKEPHHG